MSNNPSHNHDNIGEIVIREATAADRDRLNRLAELDSSRCPAEPVLIAEVDGELRAAISTVDGHLVADPWYVTADLVEVLGIHAASAERPRRTPLPLGTLDAYSLGWRMTGRRLASASSNRRTGVV
jgi:hypothetical protein